MLDFSAALDTGLQCVNISSNCLKKKKRIINPKIVYSIMLAFKNENIIKTFSDLC